MSLILFDIENGQINTLKCMKLFLGCCVNWRVDVIFCFPEFIEQIGHITLLFLVILLRIDIGLRCLILDLFLILDLRGKRRTVIDILRTHFYPLIYQGRRLLPD
jgi:hypothetical protein